MLAAEMDLDVVFARLRELEHTLPPEDHLLIFHLREMVLDLVRHGRALDEIAASVAVGDLEATYRRIDDLRADIESGTIPHWQGHLEELGGELRRRLPAPAEGDHGPDDSGATE